MSSKRRVRRKSCAGKVRHATMGDATVHADNLHKKDGHRYSVYQCGFCGGYHVGHDKYRPGVDRHLGRKI